MNDETLDMNIHRNARDVARRRAQLVARALAAAAALVGLASCGGGGSSDNGMAPPVTPVASNTPPASASQSVDGFIAYLKTVVPTMPETTTPVDVTGFVAPTSDTALPDPSI